MAVLTRKSRRRFQFDSFPFRKRLAIAAIFAITAVLTASCGRGPESISPLPDFSTLPPPNGAELPPQEIPPGDDPIEGPEDGNTGPEAPEIPGLPEGPAVIDVPLWEAQVKSSRAWTLHAYSVIERFGKNMLAGPSDVKEFCPAYFKQTVSKKIGFWVFLISAITKYESGFNPLSRMREVGLGTDSVTHLPVYSEGLLQLSYQDSRSYKFCDEFNWPEDSKLAVNDSRKTILDPFKNLTCGIRILETIVGKRKAISFQSGHYWSVLMTGSKYTKVSEIKSYTRVISACRN